MKFITILNQKNMKKLNYFDPSHQKSYFISPDTIVVNDPKSPKPCTKLPGNYFLKWEISKGAFSKVFEVTSLNDNKIYAAKIAHNSMFESDEPNVDLMKEGYILDLLAKYEGFPKVKEVLITCYDEILIMSLLGPNLNILKTKTRGKFSLKTTMMIGVQAIDRIMSLHNVGYLHRDIKPENFVIGLGKNEEKIIYLVDFGLSSSYFDPTMEHIPYAEHVKAAGTVFYLSIHGHKRIQASRRDDLISLGYMLLHLVNGTLPWANVTGSYSEKISSIAKIKSTTSVPELCGLLPEKFQEYFNYVLNLKFDETPNYEYLKEVLNQTLNQKGINNDGRFDWIKNEETNGINLNGRKLSSESAACYMKEKNDLEALKYFNV